MGILNQLQAEADSLSVLYVEDEEAVCKKVSDFLQKFFTSVDIHRNGADGLSSYRQKRQDIVITDINMPVMDGLEMAKAIKELSPNVEIIVTTAFTEQELLLKAIEIGIEQYVLKPIEPMLFATALLKAIKQIKLERRAKALNEKINNILNFQDNIIFLTDLESILLCNQAFIRFFGFKNLKEIQGAFYFVEHLVALEGYLSATTLRQLADMLESSKEETKKVKMIDKATGFPRVFVIKIGQLPNKKEFIVSLSDITDFELHFHELEFKTTHDTLTKLYNRMKFDSLLEAEIGKSAIDNEPLCLVKFDVDEMFLLNESFGRAFGDTLLIRIAEAAKHHVKQGDMLARYGDNKFIVLMPHTELGSAFYTTEQLRAAIENMNFDEIEQTVTCSFGVTQYYHGEDVDGFLGRTFKLLKLAKKSGKNCIKTDEASEKMVRDSLRIRELEMLQEQFEFIASKSEEVALYLYYKGLSVSNSVHIGSFDSKRGTLTITVPKHKETLFMHSETCYLKHDLLTKTVYAQIKAVFPDRNFAILHELSQLNNAPIDRKILRLVPARQIEVFLRFNKTTLRGTLIDISISGLSICLKSIAGLVIGIDAEIAFSLPIGKVDTPVELTVRVLKLFQDSSCGGYKVVLAAISDNDGEKTVKSYISARQLEIIWEINKL